MTQPKKTILIEEDEVAIRLGYVARLSDEFNILTTGDGLKVLEKLEIAYVDLIVTEVSLTCMNGLNLIQHIREALSLGRSAVTQNGEVEIAKDSSKSYHFTAIISKPDHLFELKRTVQELFERRKRFKENSFLFVFIEGEKDVQANCLLDD